MTKPVYSSVDEFDEATRSLLENHLSDDEMVLLGIVCTRRQWWTPWYWGVPPRKLILTDHRVIDFKNGKFSTQFMAFSLEEMNPPVCEFLLRGNYLTLQGRDIDRRYRVKGDAGREFAFAVRDQLKQQRQTSESFWRDTFGFDHG
ncbi:hypothetical protein [Halalkalicoccus ordinarius]|uniref:hypothetical protein n=1 Tax=Halalkalicoccus ordinarius TaxID=3116651 RepID=UPI00300F42E8